MPFNSRIRKLDISNMAHSPMQRYIKHKTHSTVRDDSEKETSTIFETPCIVMPNENMPELREG